MKVKQFYNNLFLACICVISITLSSCIGDQQVASRKIISSNQSSKNKSNTCGDSYFVYSTGYDSCIAQCETGYHVADGTELIEIKEKLIEDADYTYDGVDTSLILERVTNSYGVCVKDDPSVVRASDDISINSNFCSCLNGRSDLINNCDNYCSKKTETNQPMLYVTTIPGAKTGANPNQGNLYNWCKVQLKNDGSAPQCFLEYFDGSSRGFLELNLSQGSNQFSANINNLSRGRTYVMTVVENGSGSGARTKSFQLRRKAMEDDFDAEAGSIAISPITQYSCLSYGTTIDTEKNTASRTNYIKNFYYYPDDDRPAAMPTPATGTVRTIVCHDELKNPGNDKSEYQRLETIPGIFSMWAYGDERFVLDESTAKLKIHTLLENRLLNEYGLNTANINLFTTMSYPRRPSAAESGNNNNQNPILGYVMGSFKDSVTKKAFCPTMTHFNTSSDPLIRLLGDYIGDTEGLYIAEKDAEQITQSNGQSQTIYGTMFVTESLILKHGFYIENNVKIKISQSTLLSGKTTHFYWPIRENGDDLMEAGRKLYTVRTLDTINGNKPTTSSTSEKASDKRIGCVPKSVVPTIPE